MLPLSGAINPATRFSRTVLPAPFGPAMTILSLLLGRSSPGPPADPHQLIYIQPPSLFFHRGLRFFTERFLFQKIFKVTVIGIQLSFIYFNDAIDDPIK